MGHGAIKPITKPINDRKPTVAPVFSRMTKSLNYREGYVGHTQVIVGRIEHRALTVSAYGDRQVTVISYILGNFESEAKEIFWGTKKSSFFLFFILRL